MMEAALDHDGFSFIECLSECVEFFPGAFDATNPRKGGEFKLVPPDHDVTDEAAAYRLAGEEGPGRFGVLYKVNRPTKNALEAGIIAKHQAKVQGLEPSEILKRTMDRLK